LVAAPRRRLTHREVVRAFGEKCRHDELAERPAAADQDPPSLRAVRELGQRDAVQCHGQRFGQRGNAQVQPFRYGVQRRGCREVVLGERAAEVRAGVARRVVAHRVLDAQRGTTAATPLALPAPRRSADDEIADRPVGDASADRCDPSGPLVTWDRPRRHPAFEGAVQVGAADAAVLDPDERLAGARIGAVEVADGNPPRAFDHRCPHLCHR
jgi:hypothetical protein